MRKPAAMLAAALALSLPAVFDLGIAQELPQEKPAATESPLTLTEATRPDREMLVEAARMMPTQLEEFLAVADQISTVQVVDVSDVAAKSEELTRTMEERQADLELLRGALMRSEIIATALEQAEVAVDEVMAIQVIRGDVVEVVLYHV